MDLEEEGPKANEEGWQTEEDLACLDFTRRQKRLYYDALE